MKIWAPISVFAAFCRSARVRESSRSSQINSLAAQSEISVGPFSPSVVMKHWNQPTLRENTEMPTWARNSEHFHPTAQAPHHAVYFRARARRAGCCQDCRRGSRVLVLRGPRNYLRTLGHSSTVRCTTMRILRLLKRGSELWAMNLLGRH
jgi:hypothetical protein